MKKFTLTVVIAIILFGFYHATTMINNDVVAKNGETDLSGLNRNVAIDAIDIHEVLTESAGGAVVKVVKDSDVSLGLSKDSLSGSIMNSLLFNKDKKKYGLNSAEVEIVNDSDNEEIISHENDDIDIINKERIIEIYKESPQIFDIEVLKEYLKGSGYAEEDYIKAICEQVE